MMKSLFLWLASAAIGLLATLAGLNWPTMVTTVPLNLIIAEVRWPLGLILLGGAGVPLALFAIAYLQQQVSTLFETRRLLKEVHRAHELADTAEASRIEGLRQWLGNEFRAINERLDSLGAALPAAQAAPPRPSSIPRILPATWRREIKGS